VSRPVVAVVQGPVPFMNAAASAGASSSGCGSTRARAAARFAATVPAAVTLGCRPYAATKLISDSGCLRCSPKSTQLVYGRRRPSPVRSDTARRKVLSDGIPSDRPRAMLIAARSIGRPSRLSRSVSVMNSSSSLPTWSVMPMTTSAAACAGVSRPPSVYAPGLRKPSSSVIEWSEPSARVRAMVSVSIEWPNR
jgi:hypothetical protein